jgi:two-component system response regulator FlrC
MKSATPKRDEEFLKVIGQHRMDGVGMNPKSYEAESSRELLKTADPEMKRVLQLAENVAASRATILICGESGTGKEIIARFIHAKSPRAARRLVAVNCAAIPGELLESELFGFERGAFTGAVQAKPGKFELANDSTFLLDEISEMPLPLQAKLLRVIQEGEVERLGARQPVRVNVRLIATTNRDLATMVREGRFREDLYYRLNVIPLRVPALRARPADVELLARFFTDVSAHLNGKTPRALSGPAIDKLLSWRWPGNVRELENVVERAVLISAGTEISVDDIAITGFEENTPSSSELAPGMTISEAERRLIMKTLEHTKQNRTRAAQLLGISIRTLRNKLHEYGTKSSAEIALDMARELALENAAGDAPSSTASLQSPSFAEQREASNG